MIYISVAFNCFNTIVQLNAIKSTVGSIQRNTRELTGIDKTCSVRKDWHC